MKPLRNATQLRTAEMAQIHIAKKQLALEDDAYRAILLQVTGKTSSKDLTWQERKALLDHFKKVGFKVKAKTAGRAAPVVTKERQAMIGKVEALLAEAKYPWSYADALAKKICKVERIEWCLPEHLVKIIAALTKDAQRNGRATA